MRDLGGEGCRVHAAAADTGVAGGSPSSPDRNHDRTLLLQ